MEQKERYTKICPNCGSTNIDFFGAKTVSDCCKDCSYGKLGDTVLQNVFFPEVPLSEVEAFRKNLTPNQLDDFGKEVSNRQMTAFWKTRLIITTVVMAIFIAGFGVMLEGVGRILALSFFILIYCLDVFTTIRAVRLKSSK